MHNMHNLTCRHDLKGLEAAAIRDHHKGLLTKQQLLALVWQLDRRSFVTDACNDGCQTASTGL